MENKEFLELREKYKKVVIERQKAIETIAELESKLKEANDKLQNDQTMSADPNEAGGLECSEQPNEPNQVGYTLEELAMEIKSKKDAYVESLEKVMIKAIKAAVPDGYREAEDIWRNGSSIEYYKVPLSEFLGPCDLSEYKKSDYSKVVFHGTVTFQESKHYKSKDPYHGLSVEALEDALSGFRNSKYGTSATDFSFGDPYKLYMVLRSNKFHRLQVCYEIPSKLYKEREAIFWACLQDYKARLERFRNPEGFRKVYELIRPKVIKKD